MKRLTCILFGVLLLLYFLCYQGALSHVIFYHEQHHLFLFSKLYFQQSIHSEGWLNYLTDFVIQFFYFPILGSAILAFILASVYLLCNRIIGKISRGHDLFQLSIIPSVCLFFYTMSADHSLSLVVGSFVGLLIFYLILLAIQRYWTPPCFFSLLHISGKRIRISIICICLSSYMACGFYYFLHNYNRSERIMLKTEQYVKARDWKNVLEYSERYLKTGRSNQLISYFHNLALYHTGQLSCRLFAYPPRLGVKELYLPWNGDSRESEYGHILYEELGYINEAQRWEFEAMVVWGETAPHLLNLARYNIVNHRPLVARRFINKLKQSLFYRKDALRLQTLSDKGEIPGFKNALEGVTNIPVRFANVVNIGPELQYLCEQDITNKMAYEYLMSNLLLSNHVVRFAKNLKWMRRFSYSSLPPVYEEALYIYKLGVSEEEFAKIGVPISPETERKFQRYYQLVQSRQMQTLQIEFGQTYWFYLNYVSPYGNKVVAN